MRLLCPKCSPHPQHYASPNLYGGSKSSLGYVSESCLRLDGFDFIHASNAGSSSFTMSSRPWKSIRVRSFSPNRGARLISSFTSTISSVYGLRKRRSSLIEFRWDIHHRESTEYAGNTSSWALPISTSSRVRLVSAYSIPKSSKLLIMTCVDRSFRWVSPQMRGSFVHMSSIQILSDVSDVSDDSDAVYILHSVSSS